MNSYSGKYGAHAISITYKEFEDFTAFVAKENPWHPCLLWAIYKPGQFIYLHISSCTVECYEVAILNLIFWCSWVPVKFLIFFSSNLLIVPYIGTWCVIYYDVYELTARQGHKQTLGMKSGHVRGKASAKFRILYSERVSTSIFSSAREVSGSWWLTLGLIITTGPPPWIKCRKFHVSSEIWPESAPREDVGRSGK